MGRGRGKGKRQSAIAARDDNASGDDEKLPLRGRGRPQKQAKDEIEDGGDIVDKIEEEVGEDTKSPVVSKCTKNQDADENGRKRKRASKINEAADSTKEENHTGTITNASELIKPVGYRPNGSRRKNKPRRAAEVGLECR